MNAQDYALVLRQLVDKVESSPLAELREAMKVQVAAMRAGAAALEAQWLDNERPAPRYILREVQRPITPGATVVAHHVAVSKPPNRPERERIREAGKAVVEKVRGDGVEQGEPAGHRQSPRKALDRRPPQLPVRFELAAPAQRGVEQAGVEPEPDITSAGVLDQDVQADGRDDDPCVGID